MTIVGITIHMALAGGLSSGGADVGSWPNCSLGLTVSPVGNGSPTRSSFVLQGTTNAADQREFLATIGLVSTTGASAPSTPYRDKVGLYVATEARNGTGDVWAINPLVTMAPDSGSYAAQGIELDFNNL